MTIQNKLKTAILGLLMISCSPAVHEHDHEELMIAATFADLQLAFFDAFSGESTVGTTIQLPSAATLQVSNSRQYLAKVERVEGLVRFLKIERNPSQDGSSIEWIGESIEAPSPTHFISTQNHTLVFNDGDASVIWLDESEKKPEPVWLRTPDNVAHHGAAVWLGNNRFAITFKPEGEEGALPKMVKLVDRAGKELSSTASIAIRGIHGAASNGDFAVFGSMDGALVMSANGESFIIPNPAPLEASSGNWLGAITAHDKLDYFLGISKNHGVFKIDPKSKTIEPLFLNDAVKNHVVSPDGSKLVILTADLKVYVWDLAKNKVVVEKKIEEALRGSEEEKNQGHGPFSGLLIQVSNDYLFTLVPGHTSIKAYSLINLSMHHQLDLKKQVNDFLLMKK